MTSRRQDPRDHLGPDDPLSRLIARWLADEVPGLPPATLMPAVRSRLATTRRRSAWLIADRWLWDPVPHGARSSPLVPATIAIAVVLIALTGVGTSLLTADGPLAPTVLDRGAMGAPGAAAIPSPAPASAWTSPGTTVATSPPSGPAAAANPQAQVTTVHGSLPQAPAVVALGRAGPRDPASGSTVVRGVEREGRLDSDDPRLSGTIDLVVDERRFGEAGETSVGRGRLSIENAAGAWEGALVSAQPPGRQGALMQAELTGSSGYAGLSAMLRMDLGREWGDTDMVVGIVYPGSPPAQPGAKAFEAFEPFRDRAETASAEPTVVLERSALPAYVHGSLTQPGVLSGTASSGGAGDALTVRDQWVWADLQLNDPRLQVRDLEMVVDSERFAALEAGAVLSGAVRAQDRREGRWAGTAQGFEPADDMMVSGAYHVLELTGQGRNTGLTAVLFTAPEAPTGPRSQGTLPAWSVEGLLFAGPLPAGPSGP